MEVIKTKSAHFVCEIEPVTANATWYHKNVEVTEGGKYTMFGSGTMRSLTIISCTMEDTGKVRAIVGNAKTEANLYVKGVVIRMTVYKMY